jgi:hypothetical protein
MKRRQMLTAFAAIPALVAAKGAEAAWATDKRLSFDLGDYLDNGQDATAILSQLIPQLTGVTKKSIVHPAGKAYTVSGPLPAMPVGAAYIGGGEGAALWLQHPTAPLFTVTGFNHLEGLIISTTGSRTAPAVTSAATPNLALKNIVAADVPLFSGSSPVLEISDCTVQWSHTSATPSIEITGSNYSVAQRIRNCALTGPAISALRVRAGGVSVDDVFIASAQQGILVDPGPGQVVASLGVHSSGPDFGGMDQCSYAGLHINTLGGVLARSRVEGVWIGGCRYGAVLWGVVNGLDLINCDVYGNQEGVFVGPGQGYALTNSRIGGNAANGVHVTQYGRLRPRGNRIGDCGGVGPNGKDVLVDPGGVWDTSGLDAGGNALDHPPGP